MKAPFKLPVIANEELLMLNINGKLAAVLIVGDVNNWDDEKRLEYLRYIVQCVNNHDALLDACEAVLGANCGYYFDRSKMPDKDNPIVVPANIVRQITAAIAEAEKQA